MSIFKRHKDNQFITRGSDPVASVGDLEWPSVKALLETMSQDEGIDLEKLEIRKKQGEVYRVIVKAKRKAKA